MSDRSPHEAFAGHEIARIDERSLLLRDPACSNLWCTIAIDDMGQIVVFGDFGPIVFAHSRGSLRDRVAWIGSHGECDDYILCKAGQGMANVRRGMTVATLDDFEADAREALESRRSELDENDDEYQMRCDRLTWEAADESMMLDESDADPSAESAQRKLFEYLDAIDEGDDAWEWVGGLGERPIRDIALAHAALRRAHLLLEQRPRVTVRPPYVG
jgi:hypothetical protein